MVGLDQTGPTASFLPVIVLSILFGLSMDYEVFLVSRIREEYVKGGKARRAVTDGVAGVGRVIFAAAVIMGVVFSAFMLTDDRTVKSFGLGLAVAILVDALIVRLLLVPAVMHLLGDKAWYMPRWLDRLLPNLTIEPPHEPEESDAPRLRHRTAESCLGSARRNGARLRGGAGAGVGRNRSGGWLMPPPLLAFSGAWARPQSVTGDDPDSSTQPAAVA